MKTLKIRHLLTLFIGVVLILSYIQFYNVSAGKPVTSPLFGFHSYIDIQVDEKELSKPIPVNRTVVIGCTIIYSTDIPENFLGFLPQWLRNLILYWRFVPIQHIHLDVKDIPEWANISIISSDIPCYIPTGKDVVKRKTGLIFDLSEDAPADNLYTIKIKASCNRIGFLQGCEKIVLVNFTPAWYSRLKVWVDNFTIKMNPGDTMEIPIYVLNDSNGDAEVKTEIKEAPDPSILNISITPSLQLKINETGVFKLLLEASPSIINYSRTIPIEFTPYHISTGKEGQSYILYIRAEIH